jgi:hypothetical protein
VDAKTGRMGYESDEVCRGHAGVTEQLRVLRDIGRNHEDRLRKGQDCFDVIRHDITRLKIYLVLAVIASFVGGVVGPQIWKFLGW